MSNYLGIEIGGTKLQLGIGSGEGPELVSLIHRPAEAKGGAEAIRRQIQEAVSELLGAGGLTPGDIAGVAVGFGGPVEPDLATVTKSHQVEGWEKFPLADWIYEHFGWPAIIHNDADTAAYAEAHLGAGRGYNPVFYITIGSGIGGGLVIDGKIYRGGGAGASEIGHLKVPDLNTPAGLWSQQGWDWWVTLESICSGWSIGKRAESASIKTADPQELHLSVEAVAQAARDGDEPAQQLLADTWKVLGYAIAQMITLVCPQRVVIGGGVSQMGEELLFEPLRQEVRKFVFPAFADLYEIVPADLGERVVVVGALALARDAFGQLD